MRQIYETIDRQGYQWIVVLVAGLGFFLDGYTVSGRTNEIRYTSDDGWLTDHRDSSLQVTWLCL